MLDELKGFFEELKSFRGTLKNVKLKTIGQAKTRANAERIGTEWCNEIAPRLQTNGGFAPALLDKYTAQFSRLIKLSAPNNRASSYLSVLMTVTKTFRSDFFLRSAHTVR